MKIFGSTLAVEFSYILEETREYGRSHPSYTLNQTVNGLFPDLKRKLADDKIVWQEGYDGDLKDLVKEAYEELLD